MFASQLQTIYAQLEDEGEAEWGAMQERVSQSKDPAEEGKASLLKTIQENSAKLMRVYCMLFHSLSQC